MTKKTRRSFIAVAGAALSAPAAAVAATSSWLPSSGGRSGRRDTLEARVAELEDLNEIRTVNYALFSDPSSSQLDSDIRAISLVDFGAHDVIEVAADRQTATARLHVTLRTETEIGPECTLVEMARQQGSAVICASESAVLENAYVRRDGVWKILHSTRRPAGVAGAS